MKTKIEKDSKIIRMYDDYGQERLKILLHNGIATWEKNGNEEIFFTRDNEPELFDNLVKLLSNNYIFAYSSGNQSENELQFISDEMHHINRHDVEKMAKISRLFIEYDSSLDALKIKMDNPFSDDDSYTRRVYFMSGQMNIINTESEKTLEEDMIEVLSDIFKKKPLSPKKSRLSKKSA